MASLGSSASVPGPSASTSTASQHDSARPISNWIPPHLRGQMAAHGGQSGPHGSHQKTHQGTASCNSGTAGLSADDFQESRSLTLEWRLNNLKSVFDSSRGDAKSRCIKSPPFGDGKWEIYFYGNSGSDYVSLYLSAEPTAEERERGLKFAARSRSYTAAMLAKSASNPALAAAAAAAVANKHTQQQLPHHQVLANQQSSPSSSSFQQQSPGGSNVVQSSSSHSSPWIREGSFRFAFEIKSINKKEAPIKMMEAADHVFSSEARNWGWQSFARRSDVYYNNMVVRHSDSFVISCTITHTPSRPTLPSNNLTLQKRLMPLELVNAFAGMFDDPAYSDVKFVITSRSPVTGKKKEKSLYAIRKIITTRAEYFNTMFSSGFSEAKNMTNSDGQPLSRKSSMKFRGDDDEDSDMDSVDSDDLMVMYDSASEGEEGVFEDSEEDHSHAQRVTRVDKDKEDGLSASEDEVDQNDDAENFTAQTTINEDIEDFHRANTMLFSPTGGPATPNRENDDMRVDTLPSGTSILPVSPSRRYPTRRSLRESFGETATVEAGTSTMRSVSTNLQTTPAQNKSPRTQRYQKRAETRVETPASQPSKIREDRSKSSKECVTVVVKDASYSTYKALLYFLYTDTIVFAPLSSIYAHAKDTAEAHDRPFTYKSRKQFFDAYTAAVYGPTSPHHSRPKDLICSSKAIYKIADKLNIPELKNRAFEHVVQSLTIETIPYEVFSAFSDQFPEVRKVQLDMMLHYWNEVREGQAMKNILRLIRLEPERFPGYEEVWQHLLLNLEYRATTHAASAGTPPVKESAV